MRGAFLKASAARFFAVAATFASGLAGLKLYGHFFAPDVYGVIIVAVQILGYLPMLDGGFRMATNRRLLASADGRSELILFSQEIYSWLLLLSLAAGMALMAAYSLMPHASAGDQWTLSLFLAMGGCGALSVFAGAQAGLLLGLGAQAAMSIVNGLSALASVGALAWALFAGWGLWAFPLSLLGAAVTNYGLSLLILRLSAIEVPLFRFTLSREFRQLFTEVLPDAWQAFRSQISILTIFSSDIILASFFCKPAEVAIYGVTSRVIGIARMFLQIFNESVWPFVAARTEGLERFQNGMVRANAWLYGLAGGSLVALISLFIAWYMGPEWQPSALLCWLLALRFVVIGSGNPASYYLMGKGDFRNVARCTEREVVLSIALSLALGPFMGINGIAIAYLLGTAGGNLLPFWMIYARMRGMPLAPLLVATWLRLVVGFAAAWGVVKLLQAALPSSSVFLK